MQTDKDTETGCLMFLHSFDPYCTLVVIHFYIIPYREDSGCSGRMAIENILKGSKYSFYYNAV